MFLAGKGAAGGYVCCARHKCEKVTKQIAKNNALIMSSWIIKIDLEKITSI